MKLELPGIYDVESKLIRVSLGDHVGIKNNKHAVDMTRYTTDGTRGLCNKFFVQHFHSFSWLVIEELQLNFTFNESCYQPILIFHSEFHENA